ncbi:MAG: hypothetical protein FWF90_05160 [Promicromonosporaceae bacterium]|nr:hypothetical protein [Promicromonosporaceae bacterium]
MRETVVSYVVRPESLQTRPATDVPAGCYVARFDGGSVGNPAFAVLPYADGEPATVVTVASEGEATDRAPRYVRVAARAGAADYELHVPATFGGWVPSPEELA